MRGAIGLLAWEELVEWGRRAIEWCNERGSDPTEAGFRVAWTEMGCPFKTYSAIEKHHHKSFAEFRKECLGEMERVEVGEGVSINAPAKHNWENSWALLTNAYERRRIAQQREVNRHVEIVADKPICVLVLGDMHIGSASTDYPRLLWISEQLNRKDVPIYAVFVGDCVDAMIWNSVKFEGRSSPLSVHKEVLTAVGYMKEANRLGHMIGGVMGNHDLISEKLAGLSHFLLALEQAENRIPIGKNELLLSVQLVNKKQGFNQTYSWELRHTATGSSIYQRAAGPINHNRKNHRDSEFTVTGHLHKSAIYDEPLHGKIRWSIQVGAYKMTDLDDYAVEGGFQRGSNEPDYGVLLWPDRHKAEVHKTEAAIRTLEALHGGDRKSSAGVRVPPSPHRRGSRRGRGRRAG